MKTSYQLKPLVWTRNEASNDYMQEFSTRFCGEWYVIARARNSITEPWEDWLWTTDNEYGPWHVPKPNTLENAKAEVLADIEAKLAESMVVISEK